MDERERLGAAAAAAAWVTTARQRAFRFHGTGRCHGRDQFSQGPGERLCAECAEAANDLLLVLYDEWVRRGRAPAIDDRAALERWVWLRAARLFVDVLRRRDAADGIGARPDVLPTKVTRLLNNREIAVLTLERHFGRSGDSDEPGSVWPVRRWAARLGLTVREVGEAVRGIDVAMSGSPFTRRWYEEKVWRAMSRRPVAPDEGCTTGEREADASEDDRNVVLAAMGRLLDQAAAHSAFGGSSPEVALLRAADATWPGAAARLRTSPELPTLADEVAARAGRRLPA